MGRPRKQTADWFPHYVTDSRTKFILEDGWGNNGYAFWFKLLELLCRSDGHNYDCSNKADMKYLIALTKIDEATALEILNTLADLGKIDGLLWEKRRIIWCQSLVDNLSVLYSKRTVSAPEKPSIGEFPNRKLPENDITSDGNPHITGQHTKQQDSTKESNDQTPDLHQTNTGQAAPITVNLSPSTGNLSPTTGNPQGGDGLGGEQIKSQPGESLTVEMAGTAAGKGTREQPSKTLAERRFEEFWKAYPKKVGKKAAESSWKKIKPDAELHDRIMTAIGRARVTEQWQREGGRYIPNPATWLNQGRWDDEYEEVTQPYGSNSQHSRFKLAWDEDDETGDEEREIKKAVTPGAKYKPDAFAGFKRAEDDEFYIQPDDE